MKTTSTAPQKTAQQAQLTPVRTAAGKRGMAVEAPSYGIDLSRLSIQPKLQVGTPGDRWEREADRMAASILQPTHQDAPTLATGLTPVVQRSGEGPAVAPDSAFAAGLSQSRSEGRALPGPTRAFMESRFGSDFSGVRVHTGARAAALNQSIGARAFTLGQDIYFGQSSFAPESMAGRQLLAHELTHTVQQKAGGGGMIQAEWAIVELKEKAGIYVEKGSDNHDPDTGTVGCLGIEKAHNKREIKKDTLDKGTAVEVDVSQTKDLPDKKSTTKGVLLYWPYITSPCYIKEYKISEPRWVYPRKQGYHVGTSRMSYLMEDTGFLYDEQGNKKIEIQKNNNVVVLDHAKKCEIGKEDAVGPVQFKDNIGYIKTKHLKNFGDFGSKSNLEKFGQWLDRGGGGTISGGKTSFEFEIKIPVIFPLFVGCTFMAELEKEGNSYKVRTELASTFGASIFIAEVKIALGGYIEAQGTSFKEAMVLVSYGIYRRLRESEVVPHSLADGWGGETRAEWESSIETSRLVGESYVETGGLVSTSAEAGIEDIAKVSAEIAANFGKRYTQESKSNPHQKWESATTVSGKAEFSVFGCYGLISYKRRYKNGELAEIEAETIGSWPVPLLKKDTDKSVGEILTKTHNFANKTPKDTAHKTNISPPPSNLTTNLPADEEEHILYNAIRITGKKKPDSPWEFTIQLGTNHNPNLELFVIGLKGKLFVQGVTWKYANQSWTALHGSVSPPPPSSKPNTAPLQLTDLDDTAHPFAPSHVTSPTP